MKKILKSKLVKTSLLTFLCLGGMFVAYENLNILQYYDQLELFYLLQINTAFVAVVVLINTFLFIKIGKRQKINEELSRELETYKQALNQHTIVAKTDYRGFITYVNDKFCEISKYSEKEVLGKTHKIINSGYHSKDFFKDLWDTIKSGKPWRGEIRNRSKDGSIYWVDTSISPILDQSGKIVEFISFRNDITARKERENRTILQGEFYQQIQQTMEEGYIIQDSSGKIIQYNNHACRILGLSPDQLIGKVPNQLSWYTHGLSSSSFPGDAHPAMGVLKTGVSQRDVLMSIRHPNKEQKWIVVNSVPIKEPQEQTFSYVLTTYQDVTENRTKELIEKKVSSIRKVYIESRGELTKYYKFIIEILIDVTDSEFGLFSEVQLSDDGIEEIKNIYTFGKKDKIDFDENVAFLDLVPDPIRSIYLNALYEKHYTFENKVLTESRFDNEQIQFSRFKSILCIPIANSSNTIAIISLINRKSGYNEALLSSLSPLMVVISETLNNAKLEFISKEKQEYLELMAYSSELGLWHWDLKTDKVIFDQRWCEILGYDQNELETNYNTFLELVRPEDLNSVVKAFEDYYLGKIPYFEIKYEMRHKDGHWVPILSKGKVTKRSLAGVPWKFTGTHFDLTYINSVESDLETQKQVALHSAKLASIGEMAAGVSHEINNPVAIIKGYISSIKKSFEQNAYDPEKVLNQIVKIEKATDRIYNIVLGMRNYSRADKSDKTVFSMPELIKDSISIIREIYEKDGICFELNLNEPQNFFIKANRGRIQQVLMNLIDNARDATEKLNERKIKIELLKHDNQVILNVSDNGHGISEEYREKIFESFFTTKELNKGTGIGLALVKSIVEEYDGVIDFDSTVGSGTTFQVRFPQASKQQRAKIQTKLEEHPLS